MNLCVIGLLCSTLSGVPVIHDGDTLYVDGQSIRLNGVDAEELSEPNGFAARDAMRRIVGRREVTCKIIGGRTHGRLVGVCYLDGIDVGGELIRQGQALDCARFSGGRYRSSEPSEARRRLLQKPYCTEKRP